MVYTSAKFAADTAYTATISLTANRDSFNEWRGFLHVQAPRQNTNAADSGKVIAYFQKRGRSALCDQCRRY
jgi:hypothetical protein